MVLSDERLREIVGRLREIIQGGMDGKPGYETDREIYSQMHGQVLRLLEWDTLSRRAAEQQEPVAWTLVENVDKVRLNGKAAHVNLHGQDYGPGYVPLFASPQPPVPPDHIGDANEMVPPGSGVSEEIAKPSEAEFLEWLDRAYNHPGNNDRNFTKWNMEVAFHAGIAWARGRRE